MKTTFAIALVLIAAFTSTAQEQQIDKSVFDSALTGTSAHAATWRGKLYRMTVTTSAKMTEKPEMDYGARMVFEYGLPKGYRTIQTNTFGGKTKTAETLILVDSIYKRENDGPWSVTARNSAATDGEPPRPPAPTENPSQVVNTDTQFFSLGNQPFKGGTASVYKKVEKTSKVNKAQGTTSDSVVTTTYWVVDGVQRQYEHRSTNKAATWGSNAVILTEWDLDPSITFQPPLIGR